MSTLIAHYDDTPFRISAGTNKDDLDLECPLRTSRFRYVHVHICCGFRSWPCLTVWTFALIVSDKMWPMDLRDFQSIAYEFCTNSHRGFLQRSDELQSWAAKIGYYSHYESSSLLSLRCVEWPFGKTDDLASIIMFERFISHVCRTARQLIMSITTLASLLYTCSCSVKCRISGMELFYWKRYNYTGLLWRSQVLDWTLDVCLLLNVDSEFISSLLGAPASISSSSGFDQSCCLCSVPAPSTSRKP